jgi:hypothetical protein
VNAEAKLLTALISGPVATSDIPMPPRTRRYHAARLEAAGLLIRTGTIYELTKAGKLYAIQLGILPETANYFPDIDLPALEPMNFEFVQEARSAEWLDWFFSYLMAGAIAASLTEVTMVWLHFISL